LGRKFSSVQRNNPKYVEFFQYAAARMLHLRSVGWTFAGVKGFAPAMGNQPSGRESGWPGSGEQLAGKGGTPESPDGGRDRASDL
jgi:hypothetical protein